MLLDEPLVVGETRRPTTLLCTDPPSALAVTAAGASCVARAVPSDSVSFMLGAQRVPTDRFKRGVPAQGESPQRRVLNYSCTRPEPGRTDAATMFAANPEQNPSLNQKPRSIGLRSRRPSIFRENIRSLGKQIGSRLQLRCRGAGICFGIPTYTGGHQKWRAGFGSRDRLDSRIANRLT